MRTHWRDCKAWVDDGLSMSTTSNESCKLYDAALAQVCGYYNEPSLGGLQKTMDDMIAAEPEFVMGKVLVSSLKADVTPIHYDEEFKTGIKTMVNMAGKQNISVREKKHVIAVRFLSEGERLKAIQQWESILVDYPTDQLALRNAFHAGKLMALSERNRDTICRALPAYKTTTPGYSNVLSWQAFGFEETNLFDKAEKVAKLCLEIEPREIFASHTLSHVYEMQGRSLEGIDFMTSTAKDWSSRELLACHVYWHTALFYMDQGKFDEALAILDDELLPRARTSGTIFSLNDCSSLLYRLDFENVSVKDRWAELVDLSHKHMGRHTWMFEDAHLMMIACRGQQSEMADSILQGLRKFSETCTGDTATITKNVGVALCEAILAYENREYGKATDLLMSIRYDIIRIGGSNAQRDVFNQLLIYSALKSTNEEHVKLGRLLLSERRALKEVDALTDRLMAKELVIHAC